MKYIKNISWLLPAAGCLVLLSACGANRANPFLSKSAPTISHIHVGHAITGWALAPKKQGLLVVAELASISVATKSDILLEATRNGDLVKSKALLEEITREIDPSLIDAEYKTSYGLRRAAAEAITHLQLASETEDASANVQRTVTQTVVRAREIINKTDELTVFLDAGLTSNSIDELEVIAEEIALSLKSIAGGPDQLNNYGLYDFREDIESMVAREDPAYETVESFYLFNLVKLPDGSWGFASRRSRGAAGAGY